MPSYVEGVINLRDKADPVIDLRKRFGLAESERNEENRIMIMNIGEQYIGVIVDAVTEVLRISADSVEPPSSVILTTDTAYVAGIVKLEGRLIILLDLERVLSENELSKLEASMAAAQPPPGGPTYMELAPDITFEDLQVFFQEAEEILRLLDEDIVQLETDQENTDLLQEIFRAAHTLKGSSAMLGQQPMVELAHAAESFLDRLRKGTLTAEPPVVDALLHCLDRLNDLKEALESSDDRRHL